MMIWLGARALFLYITFIVSQNYYSETSREK